MSIYLLATLDTKGHEAAFLRDRLRELGLPVILVDVGCLGSPVVTGDISREEVFAAAGFSLAELQAKHDRGHAVSKAAEGASRLIEAAFKRGEVSGVIGIGGSAGTTIGTSAMRVLPLGVPKVMISTLASGQVRPWVRDKDIVMLNSVVDIAGLNRISRTVLAEGAAALAGMVKYRQNVTAEDRPLVAATMFGVTTPCVEAARKILESAGYEVVVFHATGNGGEAMESLIRDGVFAGVLDITTTELADELVGGILSAGPTRLTAASEMGIPQVVSVGALDMVNFGPRETVPPQFAERKFHVHNATVTLMRTTPEENLRLGAEIGRKLAKSHGPTAILLPAAGVSAIDREGESFADEAARGALFSSLQANCGSIECQILPHHINDTAFATAAAQRLLELMHAGWHGGRGAC